MKEFYAKDAGSRESQVVTSFFLVISKQVRIKRNGEPYLTLTLSDKTGSLEAKMWDNIPTIAELVRRGEFVKVRGRITTFNDRYEITLERMRRAEETEIDLADFLPKTSWDVEEMWHELEQFVAKVRNPQLRALLESFLRDGEISKLLHLAPAAQSLHHAYLGGLLEHVVSVCTLAELATVRYYWLDRDLLIVGAILHDIGKIHELTYTRTFGYTTERRLLGHINIALPVLHAKASAIPDFPNELLVVLKHLIISHHGRLEYGSPVEPRFPEALLLHYLDDMDSKMEAVRDTLENDPSPSPFWSARVASLGYPFLHVRKFLDIHS